MIARDYVHTYAWHLLESRSGHRGSGEELCTPSWSVLITLSVPLMPDDISNKLNLSCRFILHLPQFYKITSGQGQPKGYLDGEELRQRAAGSRPSEYLYSFISV